MENLEGGKNMKEIEPLTWRGVEAKIVCPFDPDRCRKNEGIKRYERRVENDTVIYTAECNFCDKKAMEWGYDQFTIGNDYTIKP